jgi:hypothetical protein
MQLLKDLWNVVLAVLAVIKTLVSYVRLAIHSVENLLVKLTTKKAAPVVEQAPVADQAPVVEQAPADQQPTI